jgi:hypothetical protein
LKRFLWYTYFMENKTVGILILIAIVITGVIFGLSYFNTSNQNKYTNKELGFSVIFPHGWQIVEGGSVVVQALNLAEKSKVNMNVVIKTLPPETTQTKGLDLQKLLSANNIYQPKAIKESGSIKIGGENGFWVMFPMAYPVNGQPVNVTAYQAWVLHKGKLFTITAIIVADTADEALDKYHKYESSIKAATNSFLFLS